MNKVKIGVIGAGWWATENHIPHLAERKEVELTSVCKLEEDQLNFVKNKFGFKYASTDFKEMLNSRMGFGSVMTTDARHFDTSIGPNEQGVKFRQNITPSQDGNTVELHVEQMQFSENVMRYQTSLEFLNRKIAGLMSAIKGE